MRIPAGKVEAVGTVSVSVGVSLIGAGPDKTILLRSAKSNSKTKDPMIRVRGGTGVGVRISGLALQGFTDPKNAAWDSAILIEDGRDFRVDHCRISHFGFGGVNVRGTSRGVVDHCEFVDNFKKTINNVGYGVAVFGTKDWRDKVVPGSEDMVFVEDCVFRGQRHAVASNAGAFYVFRHNHVIGNDHSQAVDAHGPGYGSKRGTQWIEVYENVIEKSVGGSTAMLLRGGGGVIFNNTIRDYRSGIALTLDYDKSLDWTRPHPIPDQVQDMWVWGNTLNGKATVPSVLKRSANHIQQDRDYFLKPKPGYKPFTYPHPLVKQGGSLEIRNTNSRIRLPWISGIPPGG